MSDKLLQAEAKKAEGNAAFAKKEYDVAIGFYSEAVALDASNHLYYSNRSICYAETGKFAEAKADGEMCIKLDPAFVKGYHRKANAEYLMGDLDASVSTIREGLKKDAKFTELTKLLRKVKAKKEKLATTARRTAAGPAMDQGIRQELAELSEQYQNTNTEMMEVKAKLESCARESRRHDLTKDEVTALPVEAPLFRAVGKMFLRSERSEVTDFIGEQLAGEEKKKADLLSRQTYLQRRMHSQEANLKDLMGTLMSNAPPEAAGGAPSPGATAALLPSAPEAATGGEAAPVSGP